MKGHKILLLVQDYNHQFRPELEIQKGVLTLFGLNGFRPAFTQ